MKEDTLSQILKEVKRINSKIMPYEEKEKILNMDCKTFLICNLCSERICGRLDQFGHLSVKDLFYQLKTDPNNEQFAGVGMGSRREIYYLIEKALN